MHKLIRITTVPISLWVLLSRQLQFMSSYYKVIAVSSNGPDLEKVAEEIGIETVGIDMTRKITPFKDLVALLRLYQLMKKEKPLIVHTHTPKAGLLGMLAASLADVPIRLHTVAGMPLLETRGIKRKVLELIEKFTYSCATMVYPNSFRMKELLLKDKYCPANKLKVIGNGSSNGIDINYFDPSLYSGYELKKDIRATLNIAEGDMVYCYIGRLVNDKGIRELITAFTRISQHRRNVKLILIGPFEPDIYPLEESTAQQIKNHPSIIRMDFQTDVRPYLAITDVFVFPSYREGFPNAVMQAGAMGVPCIVSDINGCNEIIENGKNGIIIPQKSIKSLQQAMEQLALNQALRHQLASASRKMIINRYNQQDIMNELLNEYEFQKQQEGKTRPVLVH